MWSSAPIIYGRMTDEDWWARLVGMRLRGHMRESGLVNTDECSGITRPGAKGSAVLASIFERPCVADEPKRHLVTRWCLLDVHDLVSFLKEYRSQCVKCIKKHSALDYCCILSLDIFKPSQFSVCAVYLGNLLVFVPLSLLHAGGWCNTSDSWTVAENLNANMRQV